MGWSLNFSSAPEDLAKYGRYLNLYNGQGGYEGQTVAVKRLIKPATNENSIKLVNAFLEKATTMQLMRHERIVEFIFLELETFSLVIEFMPEGTIFSYIQRHRNPPCSWSVRHQILADVCEGMEFLRLIIPTDISQQTRRLFIFNTSYFKSDCL
jgi:serine/threonine protein kinase